MLSCLSRWKMLCSLALLPFYTVSQFRDEAPDPGTDSGATPAVVAISAEMILPTVEISVEVIPTVVEMDQEMVLPQARTRPRTIPALKEWEDRSGCYTFSANARIVLDRNDIPQLSETAAIFASDLRALTGVAALLISGMPPLIGDIVLKLSGDTGVVNEEGYMLEVGDCLTISARTEHGIFNGTRTILQLLKQGCSINSGLARDWPDYPQRSLMVDVGRKYFSLDWLEKHIRDLAFLKYNYFHLHLSDNYGFRLESECHPEIVSPQHYTKAEICSLIELARRYHITIVPEIDMPGHMDTTLAAHPELQLRSSIGDAVYESRGDIDLTLPAAYRLVQDLLDEFIPLFPGPYWHIGADEYLYRDNYAQFPQLLHYAHEHFGPDAIAKDSYLAFVNWVNELVKSHGKITRVWNDGLYGGKAVEIARDMIYEHWYHEGITPQEIVDRGLYIVNCNISYLYYVLGRYPSDAKRLYETFEVNLFNDQTTINPHHPLQLGAKLHVWCDHPEAETEQQVAEGIKYPLRSLAQRNWGSLKLVSDYTHFVEICDKIGDAPGS